jgi:hypothetical protein
VAGRKAQARATNARQAKVAAIRAQEARKRRQMTLVMGAIGLVLVVIVAFIIVKAVGSSGNAPVASGPTAKVVGAATSVPQGVFDKVGTGQAQTAPQPIPGNHSLTADGKPKILYVGAEYCPFCAAERWAVVGALSRFGTFSGLGTTRSSSQDYYPDTATLSFHGASYDSKYLTFAAYETEDRNRAPLDQLPPEDEKVFRTLDAPPYVPANSKWAIPFVDLGGKFMISGAGYDPQALQGKTHLEVAQAMHDPSSDIGKAVDGTANLITARVCQLTSQQPASVCNSPGVTAAAKAMKAS